MLFKKEMTIFDKDSFFCQQYPKNTTNLKSLMLRHQADIVVNMLLSWAIMLMTTCILLTLQIFIVTQL